MTLENLARLIKTAATRERMELLNERLLGSEERRLPSAGRESWHVSLPCRLRSSEPELDGRKVRRAGGKGAAGRHLEGRKGIAKVAGVRNTGRGAPRSLPPGLPEPLLWEDLFSWRART